MQSYTLHEKLVNAFVDSELDCAQWDDKPLDELASIALKTITEHLLKGAPDDAKPE